MMIVLFPIAFHYLSSIFSIINTSDKLKEHKFNNINNDVQIENACVSISALKHLQLLPIGLQSFYWPCRMEMFNYNNHRIVLDGCHNGQSVQRFLASVRRQYGISNASSEESGSSSNVKTNSSSYIDDSYNSTSEISKNKSSRSNILVLFGAGHDKCIHDMLSELFKHNGADSVIMVYNNITSMIMCVFYINVYEVIDSSTSIIQ